MVMESPNDRAAFGCDNFSLGEGCLNSKLRRREPLSMVWIARLIPVGFDIAVALPRGRDDRDLHICVG